MVPKLWTRPAGKNLAAQPCSWAAARAGTTTTHAAASKIRFMVASNLVRAPASGGVSSRLGGQHNRRGEVGEGGFPAGAVATANPCASCPAYELASAVSFRST